ncbi:hypothetical protein SCHPADRAFT_914650 [Schizopora paradoxa]|uniref:RING-type domain-containing protein n=1 Tax=Schizopora paradoxa TaxID=27342 RepID=A0A0H2RT53_9AGAM|nr:hypothetical protein SCHPADRAFT_914650 [Schizopora paradoxa]
MKNEAKGKKRARSERQPSPTPSTSSSLSSPPEEAPVVKRSKRAVTRTCPVCEENIPVRLLAQHAELELRRVEEILRTSPVIADSEFEAGSSAGRRGAARKARQSLTALAPKFESLMDTVDHADKAVKLIKRNRKQRHTKLKEMIAQEDDDDRPVNLFDDRPSCPVCSKILSGDADCIDAHVDACIAHAARMQEEEERRRKEEEDRISTTQGLRRLGFDVLSRGQDDMEDDIDIDGDDEVVFGDAQFTESDVLGIGTEVVVDVDGDDNDEKTLRDLVAEGKVVTRRPVPSSMLGIKAEMEEVMGVGETDRIDEAIKAARKGGNSLQVTQALENKIKLLESMRVTSSTSSLCRICLDPYSEPTVSTGCWHTCCRECWLRCLGSTKLCPMCKRITAATELRRIYM